MNTTQRLAATVLAFTALSAPAESPNPAAAVAEPAASERSPSPSGARLYFLAPQDGAELTGPVTVRFGLTGMGVAPAGVQFANTGHHHLLIDADVPPAEQAIPADEQHVHFGKGQTETVLNLAPGTHTLQLVLGDHLHRQHQPAVISEKITITVK